jgi:putative DNA primase/helicase
MTDVPTRLADLDPLDPLPEEPLTEFGYARRLIEVYGERLRFVVAWNRWLIWDGSKWAADSNGQVQRWMKVIARTVTSAALLDKADKDVLRAAKRAESNSGVKGALTLASTEPEIALAPNDLDTDPYLLNCPNGILDLRTGQLRPHDPKALLTKMTGASYDPQAPGPMFFKFLERIQPDAAMREFLARLLGHSVDGTVAAHILPIFYGDGANGKSTLIDAVMKALGDYADAADPDLLKARRFDAHPTGVADLHGLRLALLHESDAGHRLAEGTVKRLTGGDRIKARKMHQDFWSFEPSHTFLMLTNHKPVVSGTDEGIWRRLYLIPFEVVIPPEERDDELGAKLNQESAAILSWLIAGYRAWKTDGFAEPDQVIAATNAYRAESDALGRFLDDRCLTMPACRTPSGELFAEWVKWCDQQREDPGSQVLFASAMQTKGFDKHKSGGRVLWHGVGLAALDDG